MTRRWIAASAVLLLTTLVGGAAAPVKDWGDNDDAYASGPEYATGKALCRKVRDAQPPAADRPDAATARALKGCNSESLYYGIGMKADPAKARQCAFVEAAADGPDGGSAFSGEQMLMTIYANGVGAARDTRLAIHYACRIEGAPAEMQGRIGHIAGLKPGDHGFGYCDDVTSGYAGGQCALHDQTIEAAKRQGRLARLTAGWPPRRLQALAPLRAAEKAFVSAIDGEVDLSGTLRAALVIEAEEAQEKDFLAMLEALQAGKAPHATAAQAKAADADLNRVYARVMAGKEEDWGTVKKADIRSTQRVWIKYRDAWIAYAAVAAPNLPADSIAAWVTGKRTAMLKGFLPQ